MRFASARGDTVVRTPTVLAWVRARDGSPLRRCVRLRTVVHCARHLQAEDARHEVPPEDAFGRHRPRRTPPFLFTPQDVKALVRAARALGPEGALPPLTYSTLFGLIASTGLRISEALNLRLEDVTSEGLAVRHTKFGKSRLLPLHWTTRRALDHYLERRARRREPASPSSSPRKAGSSTGIRPATSSVDSSGPWASPGQKTRRVPGCMT